MKEGLGRCGRAGRNVRGGVVLTLVIAIFVVGAVSFGHGKAAPIATSVATGGYPPQSCTGAGWNNSHLWISLGSCQAILWGQYMENSSAIPNETNGYNFSFAVSWLGEFTPSGQLVRLATPLAPVSGRANVTVRGDLVNLSMDQVLNVTNASGQWTPASTAYGNGPQWNVSNATVGTTVFRMGLQLNITQFAQANSTGNASSSVKFNVGVSDWPWVTQTDQLGFMLDSLGAWGSHFTFNTTSSTLEEKWNSTGRTFISVVFGGSASVSYPSGPGAVARVAEQAATYPAGMPNREAVVLVAFEGVAGNYSRVAYDPWVVFSLIPATPPSPSGSSAGSTAWVVVAVAAVALVAGLAGLIVLVARDVRIRREGEELLRGMRAAIGEEPGPPGRSR